VRRQKLSFECRFLHIVAEHAQRHSGLNLAYMDGMKKPAIMHRISIRTEPWVTYLALTQPRHLSKWWSADSTVQPFVGGKLELGSKPHACSVVVEKLSPGELIEWKIVDPHSSDKGHDDCDGTRVRFEIERNKRGGTDVAFSHQGWNAQSSCFQRWSHTWARLATKSLKSYLETGVGQPAY